MCIDIEEIRVQIIPSICRCFAHEAANSSMHIIDIINDFPEPDYMWILVLRVKPEAISYVRNQTPEICLEAVKQYGLALKYVKDQSTEICLEAVKQNGWALRLVKEQIPGFCLALAMRD